MTALASASTNLRKFIKPLFQSLLMGLLFFFILFPTGDLGDLASSKVSELTQNQVFIQFNNFSFNFTPPGLEFKDVFLETAFAPGLSADRIVLAPSLGGVISQKPYGTIKASGLFDGKLNLNVKKGQASELGHERQRVILDVEEVNLATLREMMKWGLALEGKVSLSADGQADLEMTEQPDVDATLDLVQFAIPPATVNTMMGPLTLPDLKLSQVQLKGRLSNGKFNIENGSIGKKQDDLHGKIKGFWNVRLMMMGGRPLPQMGSYDLEIDMTASRSFQAKAGLFLGLLEQYQTASPEGIRYRFKVSGSDLMGPPNITAAR